MITAGGLGVVVPSGGGGGDGQNEGGRAGPRPEEGRAEGQGVRRPREAGARVGKRGQSDAQSWGGGARFGAPRGPAAWPPPLRAPAPPPAPSAPHRRGPRLSPGRGRRGFPLASRARDEKGSPCHRGSPEAHLASAGQPLPAPARSLPPAAPQRPSRVPGRRDAESRGCASPGRSRGGRSPDSFHATCCPGPVARGPAAGTVPGGPPPAARAGWEPRSPAGSRANSPLLERGLVGEEDRGARGAATVVSLAWRLAAPRQVSRPAPRLSSPPAPRPTGEPLPLGARIPPGTPGTQGASRPRPLKSLCATPAPTGWPPGPGRACDPRPGSGRSGGPNAPSLFC